MSKSRAVQLLLSGTSSFTCKEVNAPHQYYNILCRQHVEKMMIFGIYCSLWHVVILFFQIKKYSHTSYIDIQSLKYFHSIYHLIYKDTVVCLAKVFT